MIEQSPSPEQIARGAAAIAAAWSPAERAARRDFRRFPVATFREPLPVVRSRQRERQILAAAAARQRKRAVVSKSVAHDAPGIAREGRVDI
jgi:hypothetical protein